MNRITRRLLRGGIALATEKLQLAGKMSPEVSVLVGLASCAVGVESAVRSVRESDEDFWRWWVARHVGGPSRPTSSEHYTATGRAFWGPTLARWFVELLRAGYPGEVRQREIRETREPEKHESFVEHRDVSRRVRAMLA